MVTGSWSSNAVLGHDSRHVSSVTAMKYNEAIETNEWGSILSRDVAVVTSNNSRSFGCKIVPIKSLAK